MEQTNVLTKVLCMFGLVFTSMSGLRAGECCFLSQVGMNVLDNLGSSPQVAWLDCDGTCLVAGMGSTDGRVLKFNEYDCTFSNVPFSGVDLLGFGQTPQISWLNCEDNSCLLAAIGDGPPQSFGLGRVFKFNEYNCTLSEVTFTGQDISVLGLVPQVAWLDCNGTCLLAAIANGEGVGAGRVFKFNEYDCTLSEVLSDTGYGDVLSGIGNVNKIAWLDCNGTCLLAAVGETRGRVFKFNEYDCTLSEVFSDTGYDDLLDNLLGVIQIAWLDCNGTCLLAAVGELNGRVLKFNEYDCTLSEVLSDTGYGDVLSGLGVSLQVAWLDCNGTCLLAVMGDGPTGLGLGRVFKFNEFDCTLSEVFSDTGYGDVLSGLGESPQVAWLDCNGTCLLAAIGQAGSGLGRVLKFNEYDCTLSEVSFTGQDLSNLGSSPQLAWLDCNGTCLLAAIGSGFDSPSKGRVFKFNEYDCSLSEVGIDVLDNLPQGQVAWFNCGGSCLLAAIGEDIGKAFKLATFPGLEVDVGDRLIACRGAEFCYKLTITNPDKDNKSGCITVTGLLDPSWAVTQVVDCTNGDYTDQGGGLWSNPLDNAITFNENVGDGTWTIGELQPEESICIELCATSPNVGNQVLNINVSQTVCYQ